MQKRKIAVYYYSFISLGDYMYKESEREREKKRNKKKEKEISIPTLLPTLLPSLYLVFSTAKRFFPFKSSLSR